MRWSWNSYHVRSRARSICTKGPPRFRRRIGGGAHLAVGDERASEVVGDDETSLEQKEDVGFLVQGRRGGLALGQKQHRHRIRLGERLNLRKRCALQPPRLLDGVGWGRLVGRSVDQSANSPLVLGCRAARRPDQSTAARSARRLDRDLLSQNHPHCAPSASVERCCSEGCASEGGGGRRAG